MIFSFDSMSHVSSHQQIDAVIAASQSVMTSSKFKTLLEAWFLSIRCLFLHMFQVILAFGNYMNSQRRGGAYGFKLSVFERV